MDDTFSFEINISVMLLAANWFKEQTGTKTWICAGHPSDTIIQDLLNDNGVVIVPINRGNQWMCFTRDKDLAILGRLTWT